MQFKSEMLRGALVAIMALALGACENDHDSKKGLDGGTSVGAVDAGPFDAGDALTDGAAQSKLDATEDMMADAPSDALPASVAVFAASLEGPLPPEVNPGDCQQTPSQGFAPLGPEGNQFGPTFLRCTTTNTFTLTLSNLPPHTSLDIAFLFAAIDSLDGTGTFPAGDFFSVKVDGVLIFNESFANATPSQVQSYVPPPGVELARRIDLGFQGPGGYYTDSAYDMGADPIFKNIPHVASNAVLTFTLEGGGVQGLDDESWAIDNLRVTVGNTPRAAQADGGTGDAL